MRRYSLYGLCGLLLFSSIQAHGQSIPITNSSFELPVLSDGSSSGINAPLLIGTNSGTVSSWDLTASSLLAVPLLVSARAEIINPTGPGPGNISGVNIGLLRSTGLAGVATAATMSQTLAASYTANTQYVLSADVGVENLAQVLSSFGFRLMNGSSITAETNQAALLSLLVDQDNLHRFQLTFTTGAVPPTGNIGVQFFETSLAGVAGAFEFDNVSLVATAVPEPATIALITISVGVGLGAYWNHRRRIQQQFDEAL